MSQKEWATFEEWVNEWNAIDQVWFEFRRQGVRSELAAGLGANYWLLTDYLSSTAPEKDKLTWLNHICAYGSAFARGITNDSDFAERLGENARLFGHVVSYYSTAFFENGLGGNIILFAKGLTPLGALNLGAGVASDVGNFFVGMSSQQIKLFAQGLGERSYHFVLGLGDNVGDFAQSFPWSATHTLGAPSVHNNLIGSFMEGLGPNAYEFARGICYGGKPRVEAFYAGLTDKFMEFRFGVRENKDRFFAGLGDARSVFAELEKKPTGMEFTS